MGRCVDAVASRITRAATSSGSCDSPPPSLPGLPIDDDADADAAMALGGRRAVRASCRQSLTLEPRAQRPACAQGHAAANLAFVVPRAHRGRPPERAWSRSKAKMADAPLLVFLFSNPLVREVANPTRPRTVTKVASSQLDAGVELRELHSWLDSSRKRVRLRSESQAAVGGPWPHQPTDSRTGCLFPSCVRSRGVRLRLPRSGANQCPGLVFGDP